MKKIILLVAVIFCSFKLSAQEWQTDFETAKQISSEENRPIVLVFQGSDWCAPCIKLDREIWSSEEFKAYAKDHFVMLQADFPRKKKNSLPNVQQHAYRSQIPFAKIIIIFRTDGDGRTDT